MAISGIVRPDPGKNKTLRALCALRDYEERAVVFCVLMVTTSKKPVLRIGLAKEVETIFRAPLRGLPHTTSSTGGR